MTQEELDAMMAGDLDDLESDASEANDESEESKEPEKEPKEELEEGEVVNYRVSSNSAWPPPPPTEDHKMVNQLDDVTRDSEVKATEMFDKLEAINNCLMDAESLSNELVGNLEYFGEIFTKLTEKFPSVETFSEALSKVEELKQKNEDLLGNIQMGEDEVMMTMDMMQYQDIHRQKIERVINVMRALSKYMNSLFEGRMDDEKRVSSAVHIQGDTSTEDVVSNEDIEALISSLGATSK